MAIFQVPNIKIVGISACVPEAEFDNNNYDWISEKERETLIKTIGVEKKRHAKKGTTTSDLCNIAADNLINDLNWNRAEIDHSSTIKRPALFLVEDHKSIKTIERKF